MLTNHKYVLLRRQTYGETLCKYFKFNGVAVFSKHHLTQDVIQSTLYRDVHKKFQELKKSCIECADRIIDVTIR